MTRVCVYSVYLLLPSHNVCDRFDRLTYTLTTEVHVLLCFNGRTNMVLVGLKCDPGAHRVAHVSSTLELQCRSANSNQYTSLNLTSPTPFSRNLLSHSLPPLPQAPPTCSVGAWLRRPTRRRCQCFAQWDAVSMVTPATTACVRSATRNTCRDNREGGDPAPQTRKVWGWEGQVVCGDTVASRSRRVTPPNVYSSLTQNASVKPRRRLSCVKIC